MRYRRSRCKQCSRPDSEVRISKRGLCPDCAADNFTAAVNQLRDKTGPVYRRYHERRAVGYGQHLAAESARLDAEYRAAELANTNRQQ